MEKNKINPEDLIYELAGFNESQREIISPSKAILIILQNTLRRYNCKEILAYKLIP